MIPNSEQIGFGFLVFTSLLAIVNPLSAVPLFLGLTGDYTPGHRRRTLTTAIITGLVLLIVFGMLGTFILKFFGITTEAFRITGGLLLLGIGADMMQARKSRAKTTKVEEDEATTRDQIGVIPLGIPGLVGPGAITTVITLEAQSETAIERGFVYVAIVAVMLVSWGVLSIAPFLLRRFGRTGLNVMTRIMGLLVMVIGVQFIINGVSTVASQILGRG